ncbi:MAG TPA: peptidoglycan-associated lipoprotein Pal [Bryobacteraceae bacterium]|nr:peptidoglycan-associated lipoprotein Pal [Bryobacteraceae bacterium]
MRNLSRTLGTAVFAAALMISAAGCKKKAPIVNTPPPTTAAPTTPSEPPPAAPLAVRINSFTGEPRSIERGQSATLRWSVGNSTDISIDQNLGAVAANGTRQVFPSQTTTYTLTAKGGGAQDTRSVTIEVSSSVPPPPPRPAGPAVSPGDILGRDAQDVYFDYDKNDIRADGRDTLTKDADVIKRILAADPGFTIVIEGHCDERGSEEYNLALGDRRAIAVKEFLVQLGVPEDRLKTISFGKERPVCTDQDEACYQRNRRGHLAPAQ